ncbi:phosphoribosyltransferase [Hahella ganghwensis]|uniref:phosphoribosyltransferase n=1 Tax=Hahella ganghwensis TaxID=286420 RepID=UPI000372D456|nr:phosphoribosyltransferase [Hahella ganghwensis]
MTTFANRKDAGMRLADAISTFLAGSDIVSSGPSASTSHPFASDMVIKPSADLTKTQPNPDVLVLALPRGGLPVAAPIAERLGAELDLMIVRKLGLPWHPELAMGAITTGGIRVLNDDVIAMSRVTDSEIEQVEQSEREELHRRESTYRQGRPTPVIEDRTVILVDDGIATGATMMAAIDSVLSQKPHRLLVAVPVAPEAVVAGISTKVDKVICLATPRDFLAISRWYDDFTQTTDSEVKALLANTWKHQQRH